MPEKFYAIFGDTHGHLRLMVQLCRLWQMKSGQRLDAAFVCGDLGYFPDPNNLDKATKRFSKSDPEELGFWYFTWPRPLLSDPKLERILLGHDDGHGNVTCPIYWVHGNHEDFQSLAAAVGSANSQTVDSFGRLHWLRPGVVHQISGLSIATLGGAPESVDASPDDGGQSEPLKWVGARAAGKLAGQSIDILITHGAPTGLGGASERWGSERIRQVIESSQPSFNFYAHHKEEIPPVSIGRTKCVWLNDVNFKRKKKGMTLPLEEGCMGILHGKSLGELSFDLVAEDWIRKIDSENWWTL